MWGFAIRTDEHPRCRKPSAPYLEQRGFGPPTPPSASSPRPGPPQPRPRGRAARGAAPPPAPCPLRDRAPAAPSLSHAYLSGPAAEGLPPPAPAPRPVSAIPAAGVSHAAAPAQPRLSPCAHSAGAGSPAGFMRGQRRLRAAARLAANAAARLTLPRPGVTHGGPRQPPGSGSDSGAGGGHVAGPLLAPFPRHRRPPVAPMPPPRPLPLLPSGINARVSGKYSPFRHRTGGRPPPGRHPCRRRAGVRPRGRQRSRRHPPPT